MFFCYFSEKYSNMSKKLDDIKDIRRQIDWIREIKAENNKINVSHLEHSKEKYGDGNEYEGYNSWIDFWKKNSRKNLEDIVKCPCCGREMSVTNIVGSHVIADDDEIYVTPTCDKCNSRAINDEEFRSRKFLVREDRLVLFVYSIMKEIRIPKEEGSFSHHSK